MTRAALKETAYENQNLEHGLTEDVTASPLQDKSKCAGEGD